MGVRPLSSDRSLRPSRLSPTAPTGMALVIAIRRQAERVLRAQTRDEYLIEKDTFIVLLEIADHDSLAGPMIAMDVQRVLDEESRRFRERRI